MLHLPRIFSTQHGQVLTFLYNIFLLSHLVNSFSEKSCEHFVNIIYLRGSSAKMRRKKREPPGERNTRPADSPRPRKPRGRRQKTRFRSYRIDSPVAGFISEEESPSTRRQAYKIRQAARSSTENLFSFLPDMKPAIHWISGWRSYPPRQSHAEVSASQ